MTLAPLEPDDFLRWAWLQGDRHPKTSPLTVEDLAFELGLSVSDVRRMYVSCAARVRRNQRLGIEDVFRGI